MIDILGLSVAMQKSIRASIATGASRAEIEDVLRYTVNERITEITKNLNTAAKLALTEVFKT